MTPFASAHEIIFLYSRSAASITNVVVETPNPPAHYRYTDQASGRVYALGDCESPRPGLQKTFEWNGHIRSWRWSYAEMERLARENRLVYTKSGLPRYKRFFDETTRRPLTSVWTESEIVGPRSPRPRDCRPESLFEKMLAASSREDGTVIVAPCTGTGAVVAAVRSRRWLFAVFPDHLNLAIARAHLDAAPERCTQEYRVIGAPRSLNEASRLAESDCFQFACWAAGEVGAQPVAERRRHNIGVDGTLTLTIDGRRLRIIVCVRTAALRADVAERFESLRTEVGADILLVITLAEATANVRHAFAQSHELDLDGTRVRRLQLITIRDLLAGVRPQFLPSRLGQGPPAARQGPVHRTGTKG